MLITKIIERDMWHRLLDHDSKCRNLHWHRYKAEIRLSGDIIAQPWQSNNGMIVDFSEIKRIAKDFIDSDLDHGYMFQQWDPIWEQCEQLGLKCIKVPFPPTAEHIVDFLFEKLNMLYYESLWEIVTLHSIKLWETPTGYVEKW